MVTFDSPIERCPVCREFVLLDQTQGECSREHRCSGHECPLKAYFEGIEFKQDQREGNDAKK